MPETKKPAAAKKPKAEAPETPDSTLVSVAKAIGHAAGKIAVETGIEHTPEKVATPSSKIPKLAPKNKKRLPRREKKALQKSTASRV
jgi:hypothetical protein